VNKGETIVTKGRAVTPGPDGIAPHEFGENERTHTLEFLVMLNLPEFSRTATSPLYFSVAAKPFSLERMRALGWEGGPSKEDVTNLKGIDANEVDVQVRIEEYEGKLRPKVEIMAGAGTFHSSKPLSPAEFKAKLAASTGGGGGGTPVERPPF
jgi:hypothetical protein